METVELNEEIDRTRRIVISEDGPYIVYGSVPLVLKVQVVSEYGEPLTWQKCGAFTTEELYPLCRCGATRHPPFCDGSHAQVHFDGAETADIRATARRQAVYRGKHIVVKRDYRLCIGSGFCGNRHTNVEWLIRQTRDPQVRAQVMTMIERCPSGSFTYALAAGQPDVEPDLPQQIAVVTEVTSSGPIAGPLWVTGSILIIRSDAQPLEARNRVTLCRCGKSKTKPLCDGMHRPVER